MSAWAQWILAVLSTQVLGGLGVYQLWWRPRVRNVRLARWIEQGGPWVILGTCSGPVEVQVRDGGVIRR
ncbi:hypothetical protein W59_12676 [Rhodococcus opacus RKJ300 = JCM 13270]|uniref:Uncharacterized protein n=1 Tax=Rhodococcus opacus RKJ300 = JCM 13270 TaxID=1165867 RepID=I0WT06_RHOOP|nr:hypothetical protein W59_12676 [Rhodococcus opacus RKJ300 = JCM 13270]